MVSSYSGMCLPDNTNLSANICGTVPTLSVSQLKTKQVKNWSVFSTKIFLDAK